MTSSRFLPRRPAWADTAPTQQAGGCAVPSSLAERLLSACQATGRLSRIGTDTGNGLGYYRLEPKAPADAAELFLKVVPAGAGESQLAADGIARFVSGLGVRANCLAPGYPKRFGTDALVFAYPWIQPRQHAGAHDLSQLGTAVARLHAALGEYPGAASVRTASAARMAFLQRRLRLIARGKRLAGPYPEQLHHWASAMPEAFVGVSPDAQVIHGDLNAGNVLFRDGSDKPVFLDFEDARQSWHSPSLDLAFLLERFVFLRADEYQAFHLARAVLDSYSTALGVPAFGRPGQLLSSLKWLSLRSLCLLCEFEERGSPWPGSEWEKFLGIMELIDASEELLLAVEDGFCRR